MTRHSNMNERKFNFISIKFFSHYLLSYDWIRVCWNKVLISLFPRINGIQLKFNKPQTIISVQQEISVRATQLEKGKSWIVSVQCYCVGRTFVVHQHEHASQSATWGMFQPLYKIKKRENSLAYAHTDSGHKSTFNILFMLKHIIYS